MSMRELSFYAQELQEQKEKEKREHDKAMKKAKSK